MTLLKFIGNTEKFEFREKTELHGIAHEMLYYGKILDFKFIEHTDMLDYVKIIKTIDLDKFLQGDESNVSLVIYHDYNVPPEIKSYLLFKKMSENK